LSKFDENGNRKIIREKDNLLEGLKKTENS